MPRYQSSQRSRSRFCATRLSQSTKLDALVYEDISLLRLTSALCKETELSLRQVCAVLERLSTIAHETLADVDRQGRIVFLTADASSLRRHPLGDTRHDDCIVAIKEPIKDALVQSDHPAPSWHHVISVAYERALGASGDSESLKTGSLLGLTSQARPDMIGVLGLSVSLRGYSVSYGCPAGLVCSRLFDWTDIAPLCQYVYTLYHPREDLPLFDPTVTLSPAVGVFDEPLWNVKSAATVYHDCRVKSVGYPWCRMTWIAQTPGDNPITVKDSYRESDAVFREGELYDILHEDGPASGFPIVESHSDVEVNGKAVIVSVQGMTRTKSRIVMSTSGASLLECPSLVTFLKAMYDVLEAHRWAVTQKNILHCDINLDNILINPRTSRLSTSNIKGTAHSRRPKFIDEILTGVAYAEPNGMLIDLSKAVEYDNKKAKTENFNACLKCSFDQNFHLHRSVGTPKFIARSVASRKLTLYACLHPIPTLTEVVSNLYEDTHHDGSDDLRLLHDTEGRIHGSHTRSIPPQDLNQLIKLSHHHRPRHDAESIFWCILIFLLRVIPLGDPFMDNDEDANRQGLQEAWRYISMHRRSPNGRFIETRSVLLTWRSWDVILHQGLSLVAPLINELIEQVRPEYELLTPPPNPMNLHEAMQRILLEYIHKWEVQMKDVCFDVTKQRSVEEHRLVTRKEMIREVAVETRDAEEEEVLPSTPPPKKRSAATMDGEDGPTAKKKRVRRNGVSEKRTGFR